MLSSVSVAPWQPNNVSGEQMMLIAASLDKEAAMMESMQSIKRTGADTITTCFAKEAAKLIG